MKKIILLAGLTLALAGCQPSTGNVNQNTPAPEPSKNEVQAENHEADVQTENRETPDAKMISLEDALKVFTDKYPDAKFEELSLDRENGEFYYEIEGFDESKEYEMEIKASDGSIAKDKVETDDTSGKKALDVAHLGRVEDLIAESLKDAGSDYKLHSFSIEYEEGPAYTELEIELENAKGQDLDYKYNLDTGELIKKD